MSAATYETSAIATQTTMSRNPPQIHQSAQANTIQRSASVVQSRAGARLGRHCGCGYCIPRK